MANKLITTTAFLASALLFCPRVRAQQEGITIYSYSQIVGYTANGAGFAFSPIVPVAVTALGFNSSDLEYNNYNVGLFDAGGNTLATALVTTGNTFFNQTYYQAISAIDLTPGNTYYVGAEEAATGSLPAYWAGGVNGPGLGGTFTPNPDITYLTGATGFMPPGTPPGTTPGPVQDYYTGANFEFTVVPEPSTFALLALGSATILFVRRRK